MIVVASANGIVGIDAAWDMLADGGTALDAVDAGVRLVEDDPRDHSVGYGGLPNLIGEVELDASVMDGARRRVGAVAALQGYRHAVTVARHVMERLPHVLLVGEGAARFAAEIGLQSEDLLTDDSRRRWERAAAQQQPPADPQDAAGTVDFIALDRDGHLASAVSTSGWAMKYPGRVGDSPIVGAGNYADDRWGAAACTGLGELAIRAGTARTIVEAMRHGVPVGDACRDAIADVYDLDVPEAQVVMHVVAVDRHGAHAGASTRPGTTYVYRSDAVAGAESVPCAVVAPGVRHPARSGGSGTTAAS